MKTRSSKLAVVIELPSFKLPKRDSAVRLTKVAGLVALTAASAIVTKEARSRANLPPLAQVESHSAPGRSQAGVDPSAQLAPHATNTGGASLAGGLMASLIPDIPIEVRISRDPRDPASATASKDRPWLDDPQVRYFNGRPVRPARTINMLVTAYSPDERSCEGSDDGVTASIHSVITNDGCLVAADTRIVPMGAMVTVPGYDDGRIVPVLDRGGAIKGRRLDVLYPTHSQAKKWGAQTLTVTVWEYADGLPADDYRKLRGTRRNWR